LRFRARLIEGVGDIAHGLLLLKGERVAPEESGAMHRGTGAATSRRWSLNATHLAVFMRCAGRKRSAARITSRDAELAPGGQR
jgi:hypothetical protein